MPVLARNDRWEFLRLGYAGKCPREMQGSRSKLFWPVGWTRIPPNCRKGIPPGEVRPCGAVKSAEYLGINTGRPSASWYESGLFWGLVGAAIAFVLAALTDHNLRWLLWLAWLCSILLSFWFAKRTQEFWAIGVMSSVLSTSGFVWFYQHLKPSPVPTEAAQPAKPSPPPSQPKPEENASPSVSVASPKVNPHPVRRHPVTPPSLTPQQPQLPPTTNVAPNGFAVSGGKLEHPTVNNNYAAPESTGPNDAQLAESARNIARRLREEQNRLDRQYAAEVEVHRNPINGPFPFATFINLQISEIQPIRKEAIALRRQILNRVPQQPENTDVTVVLDDNSLAGPHPLYGVADYFEGLAQTLELK
jgi:hypothetical protein